MFFLLSSNVLLVSLVSAAEGSALTLVTARPGDDVLLQCQVHGDKPIALLEWIRPDLKEDGFVFFYRNQRLLESFQLPSYRGRVQLKGPELKDGDASVVLRNATVSDTGTYQCVITTPDSEIKSSVELTVSEVTTGKLQSEGNQEVNPAVLLPAVGGLFLVLAVAVSVACFFKRSSKPLCKAPETPASQKNLYKPAATTSVSEVTATQPQHLETGWN